MSKTNSSLSECVESSFEAFDISSNILQLEYISFIDKSVKATIQIIYDLGLFDRFFRIKIHLIQHKVGN